MEDRQSNEEKGQAFGAGNASGEGFETTKTEFISHLSRDVRTPMNTIIGMTAIAGAHLEDKERVADCLEKITVSCLQLMAFINELTGVREAEESTDPAERTNFKGSRALLAEDDNLNAEIAAELLSMIGFEVEWAKDGRQAVDRMAAAPKGYYDVVLLDVRMPGMDGIDAARAIRELPHPDAKIVPIFAMTANAFEDDVRACLDAGMNEHIAKPLDIRQLLTLLNRWLGKDGEAVKEYKERETLWKRRSVHSRFHREDDYGLTRRERSIGLHEYNHPLFRSQAHFTDSCWEINLSWGTVVMLQDGFHPELIRRRLSYESVLHTFSEKNIVEEDRAKWLAMLSPATLSEKKDESYFEVRMYGEREKTAVYRVTLTPGLDAAGNVERVYLSSARRNTQEDR